MKKINIGIFGPFGRMGKDIIEQIVLKSQENLFNDKTVYKQYIEFFEHSVAAARKNELLPIQWNASLLFSYPSHSESLLFSHTSRSEANTTWRML